MVINVTILGSNTERRTVAVDDTTKIGEFLDRNNVQCGYMDTNINGTILTPGHMGMTFNEIGAGANSYVSKVAKADCAVR